MAYGYIKEHAADVTYMNANISTSEALDIAKFVFGVIMAIVDLFSSKEKSRDEEIAEFLSKYTRMELFESVRRIDGMTANEKIEHLAKYDD